MSFVSVSVFGVPCAFWYDLFIGLYEFLLYPPMLHVSFPTSHVSARDSAAVLCPP